MPDSIHNVPVAAGEIETAALPSASGQSQNILPARHRETPRGYVSTAERHKPSDVGGTPLGIPYSALYLDSAAGRHTDSVAVSHGRKAIVIGPAAGSAAPPRAIPRAADAGAASWLILGLVGLFMLIALRYRRHFKFTGRLVYDLASVKRRRNMFDDTVRETIFGIMLNVLCIVSVGLLLSAGLSYTGYAPAPAAGYLPESLGICLLLTAGYYLCQLIAYLIIGRVFVSRSSTKIWIRGFTAGQSLLGIVLFPLAMLSVFYPAGMSVLLILSLSAYLSARLLFIFKGARIFSQQKCSYILFLYYLCSIEIVPVLLIWNIAACMSR